MLATYTPYGLWKLFLSLVLTCVSTASSGHILKRVLLSLDLGKGTCLSFEILRHLSHPHLQIYLLWPLFTDLRIQHNPSFSPWPAPGHTLPQNSFYHVLSVGPGLCPFDSFHSYLVEFSLCASPCARLWGCSEAAKTTSPFPQPQTVPFLPVQARRVSGLLPFSSWLGAFFPSLLAARASSLCICHGTYPLFLLHSFYLWMELTFLFGFSRKQGL